VAKKKVAEPTQGSAKTSLEELVASVIKESLPHVNFISGFDKSIQQTPFGKTVLGLAKEEQVDFIGVALNWLARLESEHGRYQAEHRSGRVKYSSDKHSELWNPRYVVLTTLRILLRRNLPFTEPNLIRLMEWPLKGPYGIDEFIYPLPGIASAIESYASANEIGASLRKVLESYIGQLRKKESNELRKIADRLQPLISAGTQINIRPGEAWSDVALADLKKLKAKPAKAWNALLIHCLSGGKAKFTDKWAKAARPLIDAVGFDSLKEHLLRWFPLVDKPRTQSIPRQHEWEPHHDLLIEEPHVELLRGLVWCCGLKEDADLARAVARLALSAYRKVPGKGPRLVSLGNASVTTLGMMPGRVRIGQLAVLKVKVKFGTAQKEIEKAFNASAEREGLPRDEVEELAVPSYGLDEVGVLRESFGDYRAELLVDGSSAALHWSKDGKPIRSVPASVKKEHGEEFKELQASLKDINAMLPAQRERIDTLFLAQKRWPLAVWKERYLDHPLVGTIARRLIWDFGRSREPSGTGPHATSGIWHDGKLVGPDGKPLTIKGDVEVSLWHPIDRPMADVLAWRDWLEKREVIQPFKQAHREVYILTDAERRTGAYSNRFAAHILRQHQFNALCAARGWKNKLRLMVDDTYPPAHRLLPQWNLRAEYWVEGAGTEYGTDTNESGVYLYLVTDQVRFYSIDAAQVRAHAGGGGYTERWNPTGDDEPLPLERVPPLVFSEIMRDVDLFVGVGSVGNDPNWADGGPGGQYRDYWQSYSFGELSSTAQTRRTLLERLIPRLKIKDQCSFTDRFLVVRGSKRTYKIHLGSGNILMEPNDQYLCIVPKQTVSTAGSERVQLPFEGDGTLSIILSKAFLLADDAKITDPTITSQLAR
jgi:hypothetical protein